MNRPKEEATRLTMDFDEIGSGDIPIVGGKNASLGEMWNSLRPLGINVLDGFATTADAYRLFLRENDLERLLIDLLSDLDVEDTKELQRRGAKARRVILDAKMPLALQKQFADALKRLRKRTSVKEGVAVRSSATAEDLPLASFAGAAETYLNVRTERQLIESIQKCFASIFSDRAISYRGRMGFEHSKVAVSVGIQPMVRSDLAASGVIFTLDTESGFRNVVQLTGSYGLGEYVVKGRVTPDEWVVFKPTLADAADPIISRRLGSKERKLVYSAHTGGTVSQAVPSDERRVFSITDTEVKCLARWACSIEKHYSALAGRDQPMDIEWAKDGKNGDLYIIQARPETVHSAKRASTVVETFRLRSKPPKPLLTGQAVGRKIVSGVVRVIKSSERLSALKEGEILVASSTNPDWEPAMKRVAAIITDRGGRTAHAAIVSRELGLACVVGCGNATEILKDGETITVSCAEGAEGAIYQGKLEYDIERSDIAGVPPTRTEVMMNIADPAQAFDLAALPSDGVGLARIEFIITHRIGIHPMALIHLSELKNRKAAKEIKKILASSGFDDPREFFISKLSEGVAMIAAAFYPRPVIVRTSDFKTSEYAALLGGAEFEPDEENPMLGFRGASRYYDDRYRDGFALECAALTRVRTKMRLTNVKVMIPFCRTAAEGRKVIEVMNTNGLRQHEDGLEVYAMCELPSNVVRAEEFLDVFDGFSIGSNDLTQLILGIDRDSGTISELFDEEDAAVKDMIASAIETANLKSKPIGICGQAPSDRPGFAAWLVEKGITSISLNPDSVIETKMRIHECEKSLSRAQKAATAKR
jgi:pyruvate,water dikinase